jgi:hypothetical protein
MKIHLQIDKTPITINIPDLVVGDTVIKRKAELFTLIYNQATKQVCLSWTIKSFANNGGQYGDALPFIPNTSKEMIADNSVFVNPANGQRVEKNVPIPDTEPQEFDYPCDYISEYEFFFVMAASQPIKLHDVIMQYGTNGFNS